MLRMTVFLVEYVVMVRLSVQGDNLIEIHIFYSLYE